MKKTFLSILVFILVACSSPTTTAATPTATAATTQTFAAVAIAQPTATATLTLIPPTSTVDLAHLPTATLQPAAACPVRNEKLRISLGPVFRDKKAPYHDTRTVVLNFLNAGGDPKTAISKLAENNVFASLLDLTHDGVPELIIPSGFLTVFGCQNGQYVKRLDLPPSVKTEMAPVALVIQDLNQNGILELLIGQVQSRDMAIYRIYEWDGARFANIGPRKFLDPSANLYIEDQIIYGRGQSNAEKGALEGNWEIKDVDANGLPDILLRAGVYDNFAASSRLEDTLILKWDGRSYIVAESLKEATPTPSHTFTPLPFSETCSIKVPELRFQQPAPGKWDEAFIDYLNAGGMPEKLQGMKFDVTIRDLNDDTVPEIIVYDYSYPEFLMFTCHNGKYEKAVTHRIQEDIGVSFVDILAIKDNNKNGFPEVFVEAIGCLSWRCGGLYVIEWDGTQFAEKIRDFDRSGAAKDYARLHEPNDAYLKDLDGDGIAEFIWTGELSPDWSADRWAFYPQRLATHAYKWDGMYYAAQPVEYTAPTYRFQAVQDGDRYSKAGLYEQALKSYQLAIKKGSLLWWTEDLHNSLMAPHGIGPCAENPSACPYPVQDPNERPVLTAYAFFKSMVVYDLMGDPAQAEKTYQELLAAHRPDSADYKIAGMASAFRDEYQSSHDIARACSSAIAYIKTQPNVLLYLSGSHTTQYIWYERDPSEVCPFK